MDKKKTILIIDDEKDFASILKKNLELRGDFNVIVADEGKGGLWAVSMHSPDVILLDLTMPGMDGFEVLRKLKSNPKTVAIPVIILTARDDDEFREKASSLYNEGYLVKPVGITELLAKLEEVFSRQPTDMA